MSQPTEKFCRTCRSTKPLDDFNKGDGLHGRKTQCRTCTKTAARIYRAKHPDCNRSPKSGGKRTRKYVERVGTYTRDGYLKRRDVMLARKRARRAELKARSEEQIDRDRLRLHPEGVKSCGSCRETLGFEDFHRTPSLPDGLSDRCAMCKRAVKVGPDELAWWAANGMDPGVCTYCGLALSWRGRNPSHPSMHIDHIWPRSLGGSNAPENLAPSCGPCNQSKSAKPLAVWLTAA